MSATSREFHISNQKSCDCKNKVFELKCDKIWKVVYFFLYQTFLDHICDTRLTVSASWWVYADIFYHRSCWNLRKMCEVSSESRRDIPKLVFSLVELDVVSLPEVRFSLNQLSFTTLSSFKLMFSINLFCLLLSVCFITMNSAWPPKWVKGILRELFIRNVIAVSLKAYLVTYCCNRISGEDGLSWTYFNRIELLIKVFIMKVQSL